MRKAQLIGTHEIKAFTSERPYTPTAHALLRCARRGPKKPKNQKQIIEREREREEERKRGREEERKRAGK
jgi:hypothetical protein